MRGAQTGGAHNQLKKEKSYAGHSFNGLNIIHLKTLQKLIFLQQINNQTVHWKCNSYKLPSLSWAHLLTRKHEWFF